MRVQHRLAFVAGEKAHAKGHRLDGGAIAVCRGPNKAQVVIHKGLGVIPRGAKVKQPYALGGRVVEKVAPVGVRLVEGEKRRGRVG